MNYSMSNTGLLNNINFYTNNVKISSQTISPHKSSHLPSPTIPAARSIFKAGQEAYQQHQRGSRADLRSGPSTQTKRITSALTEFRTSYQGSKYQVQPHASQPQANIYHSNLNQNFFREDHHKNQGSDLVSRTYASAQAIGASSLATEGPLQPYALFHHASSKQVPAANENTYDPNGQDNMAFQYAQDHVQVDVGASMSGNSQIFHSLRDDGSGDPAK